MTLDQVHISFNKLNISEQKRRTALNKNLKKEILQNVEKLMPRLLRFSGLKVTVSQPNHLGEHPYAYRVQIAAHQRNNSFVVDKTYRTSTTAPRRVVHLAFSTFEKLLRRKKRRSNRKHIQRERRTHRNEELHEKGGEE